MLEKTADQGFVLPFALQQYAGTLIGWWNHLVWSVRFARACTRELQLNETQGQFHKLAEDDCLNRIVRRAGSIA